jgi:hypothetical protein
VFERDLPFHLRVIGQIDCPHSAFAECANNRIPAESSLKPDIAPFGGIPVDRRRQNRLLSVRIGRLFGLIRRPSRSSCGRQLANFDFSRNERTELIGNLGVL